MKPSDRICVIGGGRIGLPISVSLSGVGAKVEILDLDEEKISKINSGKSPFFEEGMQEILEISVAEGRLKATSNQDVIARCNIIISAIGTGINEDGTPDVESLEILSEMLSGRLNPGDILILKTTVPIGTTEKIANTLSKKSGLKLEEELLVAFCPERIVEGKAMHELEVLPKIVGGVGPKSTEMASDFMSIFGGDVIAVSNSRTAEMCKLIDNSYRMTRFGFSADIAAVSWRNGINAFEAIRASNHNYDRNNVPLPSIGVSGYCLTKDPYYLDVGGTEIWKERGFLSTWISARKAADFQTQEAVERVMDHFSGFEGAVRIVIAGATYKENIDDSRFSHGRILAKELAKMGCEILFWDPMSEDGKIEGFEVKRDYGCIAGNDCIIFAVPHSEYVEWANSMPGIDSMRTKVIFDGWGIVENVPEGVFLFGTGVPKTMGTSIKG